MLTFIVNIDVLCWYLVLIVRFDHQTSSSGMSSITFYIINNHKGIVAHVRLYLLGHFIILFECIVASDKSIKQLLKL